MKKYLFLIVCAFFSTVVLAQDGDTKQIDVNIKTDDSNWYASPWIWIVGAAVFILLLVALTRGRRD